jgi:transposase
MTNREIMIKYGIKNVSQIKTWMRWFRENEVHRFNQLIGKQYTYGHGLEGQSDENRKNRQIHHLRQENEILKSIWRLKKR